MNHSLKFKGEIQHRIEDINIIKDFNQFCKLWINVLAYSKWPTYCKFRNYWDVSFILWTALWIVKIRCLGTDHLNLVVCVCVCVCVLGEGGRELWFFPRIRSCFYTKVISVYYEDFSPCSIAISTWKIWWKLLFFNIKTYHQPLKVKWLFPELVLFYFYSHTTHIHIFNKVLVRSFNRFGPISSFTIHY